MLEETTSLREIAEKYKMMTRALNVLWWHDIKTLGDFMRFDPADVVNMRNAGPKSRDEIIRIQELCRKELESQRLTTAPLPCATVTPPSIDWEQRRYEIAKEVLPVFAELNDTYSTEMARVAVYYADALVAELKKGAEE